MSNSRCEVFVVMAVSFTVVILISYTLYRKRYPAFVLTDAYKLNNYLEFHLLGIHLCYKVVTVTDW